MEQERVLYQEQECDDCNYQFYGIQVLVTRNLINLLKKVEGLSPLQIFFIAQQLIFEHHPQNADYLQVFQLKRSNICFWCISNKEVNDTCTKEDNITFLLPSDY